MKAKKHQRIDGVRVATSGNHSVLPGLMQELNRIIPQLTPELARVVPARFKASGSVNSKHSSKPIRWTLQYPTKAGKVVNGYKMKAIGEYARQDVYFVTHDPEGLEKKIRKFLLEPAPQTIQQKEEVKMETNTEEKATKMHNRIDTVKQERLKVFMNETGLTRKEAASLLGVAYSTFNNYVREGFKPSDEIWEKFIELEKIHKMKPGSFAETMKAKTAATPKKSAPAPVVTATPASKPAPAPAPQVEKMPAPEPVSMKTFSTPRTMGERVDMIIAATEGLPTAEIDKLWRAAWSLVDGR